MRSNLITNLKFLIALILVGCSESPPKSIQDLNPNITAVKYSNVMGELVITISLNAHNGSTSANRFSFMVDNVFDIVRDIVLSFPFKDESLVRFHVSTELTDQYGVKASHQVLQLAFDVAEVKKINFKNPEFTSWNLLNFANPPLYDHPAGKYMVKAYCENENNRKYADKFCLEI